jgi:hypothetical protein
VAPKRELTRKREQCHYRKLRESEQRACAGMRGGELLER